MSSAGLSIQMSEIRIGVFGERRPRRTWVTDGLECCTYHGMGGALNGYVRLPETHPDLLLAHAAELMPGSEFTFPDGTAGINYPRGYDYIDVDAPGGWTYGPDFEGWVGFDTGHAWDYWPPELRLALCETDHDRKYAEFMITMDMDFTPFPGSREWTEQLVEDAVSKAAGVLAERARVVVRCRQR